MPCEKCGYKDKKEIILNGKNLCRVCATFAPNKEMDFLKYVDEKIDWATLDTFRKYGQVTGQKQKLGMSEKAKTGKPMTRAPLGYTIVDGKLEQNEESSKVHSLFTTFLNKNLSLNSLSKSFGISINGIKKILANRTYLGEIKFNGQLHKGTHKSLVSPKIFYAVQRKLKHQSRPRQKISQATQITGTTSED